MIENQTEESGFEEFATKALRLHRKGSFETLLAQHLAVATPADPLQKVRLVCEAAYMVPADKLDLDMQQISTIYSLVLAFLNTPIKAEFICVAWSFPLTVENYERFIKPWHRNDVPLSFSCFSELERQEKNERLEKAKNEAEAFFLKTHEFNLSLSSLQVLKAEFLRWSVPIAMQVFEQLSRLVDPDLYKELLGVVKPKTESVSS